MFGNKKNLPKREAKEVKISNRKIIEDMPVKGTEKKKETTVKNSVKIKKEE